MLLAGTEASSDSSLACLRPRKPTWAAKIRASRRLVTTTLISPLSYRDCRLITPNSSSSCCTSRANRSLRVEYETWMVLRGSSEDEPSPSKSAWRKARLIAAGPCQTNSGTNFAALRARPARRGRSARSAVRSWTSSSCSVLPEAMVRSLT